ncbi:MAG TPA: fused MFS/spermidine synthase, partial [Polyangiaceae bacterium]
VFDGSVLMAAGMPRAELLGSTMAAAIAFLVTRQRLPRAERLTLVLVPPLAAAGSLAFEALSLVLCPYTFELNDLWSPLAYSSVLAELQAKPGMWDRLSATAAGALSLGVTFTFVLLPTRDQRRRFLRSLATAVIAACVLMLLVPVAGSSLGSLPLPPLAPGGAAALPRTGLLCVPIMVAVLLFWSMRRSDVAGSRFTLFARSVAFTFTGVALAIELLPGRSSLGSIAAAVILSTLSQLASNGMRLPSGADAASAPSDDLREHANGTTAQQTRVRALLTAVFFFSGMAALLYQVVFAKGLALTFGSTSHASTIVLATYMGGLALGSWTGGKWAARLARPVLGYALAELGIAAICSMAPLTLHLARKCYVSIASGADPSEPWLVGLQLALGAIVLVPPTWLMGLTMPLLTRQFLDERSTLGRSAGLLYTANTAGAAAGACLTGYLVLPALGVGKSLLAAVLTNVLVALFAIFAARGQKLEPGSAPKVSLSDPYPSMVEASEQPTPSVADTLSASKARRVAIIAITQLAIGGFVTFGLETTFVHLLATVAGTSAYAFSLMLFAFLIGLSLGASLVRRILPNQANLPLALLLCQLALATTLLVACRYWDYLPAYFALFG